MSFCASTKEKPQAAHFNSTGKRGLCQRDRFQPCAGWNLKRSHSFELQLGVSSMYLWLWKGNIHRGAISLGLGAKGLERKVPITTETFEGGREEEQYVSRLSFGDLSSSWLLFLIPYVGVLQTAHKKESLTISYSAINSHFEKRKTAFTGLTLIYFTSFIVRWIYIYISSLQWIVGLGEGSTSVIGYFGRGRGGGVGGFSSSLHFPHLL